MGMPKEVQINMSGKNITGINQAYLIIDGYITATGKTIRGTETGRGTQEVIQYLDVAGTDVPIRPKQYLLALKQLEGRNILNVYWNRKDRITDMPTFSFKINNPETVFQEAMAFERDHDNKMSKRHKARKLLKNRK